MKFLTCDAYTLLYGDNSRFRKLTPAFDCGDYLKQATIWNQSLEKFFHYCNNNYTMILFLLLVVTIGFQMQTQDLLNFTVIQKVENYEMRNLQKSNFWVFTCQGYTQGKSLPNRWGIERFKNGTVPIFLRCRW